MAYTDELDEIMESICDRCRYVVEVDGQDELDEICAGCTIRDEIEAPGEPIERSPGGTPLPSGRRDRYTSNLCMDSIA
mgnify:CR=1 FL=1